MLDWEEWEKLILKSHDCTRSAVQYMLLSGVLTRGIFSMYETRLRSSGVLTPKHELSYDSTVNCVSYSSASLCNWVSMYVGTLPPDVRRFIPAKTNYFSCLQASPTFLCFFLWLFFFWGFVFCVLFWGVFFGWGAERIRAGFINLFVWIFLFSFIFSPAELLCM